MVALRIQTGPDTPPGTYDVLITGGSGSQSRADTIQLTVMAQRTDTFYPTGDTSITGYDYQNQNNGLATDLRLQTAPWYSHVLLQFSQQDIRNRIGTGEVVSATVKLYIETNFNNWPGGYYPGAWVDIHKLTVPWVEYLRLGYAHGATWNCAEDTDVSNAVPDCATQWNGGTYDSTIISSVRHQNGTTGWISFDVTDDVRSIVQGGSHYGWLVRKRNWTDSGSVDYTSIQGTSAYRPKLEVVVQE